MEEPTCLWCGEPRLPDRSFCARHLAEHRERERARYGSKTYGLCMYCKVTPVKKPGGKYCSVEHRARAITGQKGKKREKVECHCTACGAVFFAVNGAQFCPICREARIHSQHTAAMARYFEKGHGPCARDGCPNQRPRPSARYCSQACFALAQIGVERTSDARAKMAEAQKQRTLRDGPPPYARSDKTDLIYRGIQLRSPREVEMAKMLDAAGEEWCYEPFRTEYEKRGSMRGHWPDFLLIKRNLIIEVKGDHASNDNQVTLRKKRDSVLALGYSYAFVNWPPPYDMKSVLAVVGTPLPETAPPVEKSWEQMSTGERLRTLRFEHEIAQWLLVERSGLPQKTISEFENDVRAPYRIHVICGLARAFQMTPQEFIEKLGLTKVPQALRSR